jgi:dTDP-glucose pyrophosphorylase
LRQTCCVKLGKDNRILEIIEKPKDPPFFLRGCGVYLFRPEIFHHIRRTPVRPQKKAREITYIIDALAKQGNAYGFPLRGHNININNYDDLLEANELVKRSQKAL